MSTPTLTTIYDCQTCNVRPRRLRITTLEGVMYETCWACLYIASPNNVPRDEEHPRGYVILNPSAEPERKEPCDGAGTFEAGVEYVQDGYLTYAMGVACTRCKREFDKLVARKKDQLAYIPQHGRV